MPAFEVLNGSQAFKLSIHHDRQSCTQCFALFHAKTKTQTTCWLEVFQRGAVSKETVVLRRRGRETQKFGFIN